MISITQRLVNAGRGAAHSSTQTFVRSFAATAPIQQSQSFDLDELDEEERPERRRLREKFVNKISLYGTVGKKPEEFGLEGKEVTIFPLLTKNYYGPYNQKTEEKNWHKVMITRAQQGTRVWALDNLNPGDKVLVTGAIYYKKIDAEDRDAGRMTTIVADTAILGESREPREPREPREARELRDGDRD